MGLEIPPLPVEKRFIYGVITSAEVMPFCYLPPNLAVLPIIPRGNGFQVITRDLAERLGYNYLVDWLKEVEKIWNEVRDKKREKFLCTNGWTGNVNYPVRTLMQSLKLYTLDQARTLLQLLSISKSFLKKTLC